MSEIIELEIKNYNKKENALNIYEAREMAKDISLFGKKIQSDVTIVIQAYNQLEKLKRCVESVLEYTENIDYDLLLIDNGSEAEVFEYFKDEAESDDVETALRELGENDYTEEEIRLVRIKFLSEMGN